MSFACLNSSENQYTLERHDGVLKLSPLNKKKGGAIFVDFDSAETEYRRNTSGVKQDIAKAVGCKNDFRPRVLDVTAGFGGDAFVLASLGCEITLIENNPVVHALLFDGIERAKLSFSKSGEIVREKMCLETKQNALDYMQETQLGFDVVYLDPMFPERHKSAKVKKTMQYFHDIVGFNLEQELNLLQLAQEKALKRVVVKRPKMAPFLAEKEPTYSLQGKTVRHDIYLS